MPFRHALYEALGDETRLTIITRLGERGPLPTLELVEGLGMTRQAATKHLVILEEAGLITSCPKGRQVVRELDPKVLREAGDWLAARAKAWDCKLEALRKLVE